MSISTEITRIQQAKADIKTAIEAKGVTVPSSATIDTYDDYVSQISGGGGAKWIEVTDEESGTTLQAIPSYITSVEIPSGITSINAFAFQYCSNLESIDIPSGVTSIGAFAFNGCTSLSSIIIPSGVTTIGASAFLNCSGFTSIEIPSGITTIGASAFLNCSGLTSVTVNATVPPTLDSQVFANTNNCPIYVPRQSLNSYREATNWSEYTSRILPMSIESTCYEMIAESMSSAYTASTYDSVYSYSDSKWYEKNNLNKYEEYGIYDIVDNLSSATTYDGKLAVIGNTEYKYSGDTWVEVGTYEESTVTYEIDNDSTKYQGVLMPTTLRIPKSDVESMGFLDLRISDQGGGNLNITLGMMDNYNYNYSEQGTVTSDSDYYYLSLPTTTAITVNTTMFMGMGTVHLIASSVDATVEYTAKQAPSSSLTYSTLSQMDNVQCPNVGVNQYCFVSGNSNIYEFTDNGWDKAVSTIYVKATNNDNTVSVVGSNIFGTVSGITEAMIDKSKIVSAEIFNGVANIGEKAFYSASSLTSVTIPNSVTSIDNQAFNWCTSLTTVNIGSGVTTISGYAFGSNRSLTSITIPNSVTSIGWWAFNSCTSLTSITIPDSVTSLENGLFNGCTGLTSVNLGSGVTSIGQSVFGSCSGLNSITIPSGVTSIGEYAFSYCGNLNSITILATTPPTLSSTNAFDNTNNCPIFVPSSSVDTYKAANKWSSFSLRIQAIPNS